MNFGFVNRCVGRLNAEAIELGYAQYGAPNCERTGIKHVQYGDDFGRK